MAVNVGRRMRTRREELGLNQRELAANIPSDAVDNQRISDWERGVNKPSDRYMEQVAEALGKPVAWFYEDDEPAETPDLMSALGADAKERNQLDHIEAKLDALLAHFAVSDPAAEVEELLGEPDPPSAETDDDSDEGEPRPGASGH
jgi:transcriptional regulator with XRE-family HTH domain